jgi:capsular polysaccharide biosynthesis protein
MKIDIFKSASCFKNIFPKDDNNREINVYKFDDVQVTGKNLFYPNMLLKTRDQLILPLLEKTMSLKIETIYQTQNMEYEYHEADFTRVINEPLFFFVYNTDNYYHFIYDTLPYLISYFELKKNIPNLKLLMQHPNAQKKELYRFVIEFLEILDISKNDIRIANSNYLYNEIYISTSYTHDIDSNLPPRKEIFCFYKKIVDIVKNSFPVIETPKKIYVSRRSWIHNDWSNIGTNYTERRKFTNEDDLVKKLIIKGYQEVFTENLTTIEKIQYFANATNVVGAIGGGIANVLFSSESTNLLAIVSPTFLQVNMRFKYCLDCVNVSYDNNTKHTDTSEFKTYMRVKTKHDNIIGEIKAIHDNKLFVSVTDRTNIAWNAQNNYKQIELSFDEVEKLDDGLNSPWVYEIPYF